MKLSSIIIDMKCHVIRNVDLFRILSLVTDKIRARRMHLAGHCVRDPELAASNLNPLETEGSLVHTTEEGQQQRVSIYPQKIETR